MVFKRRDKQTWLAFLRGIFYPRKGWRRAFEYVGHRVKRLPDTPHNIALGFSCGVFVSFSPMFGLHFIYAVLCAMALRANVLASLLGTFFGNPLTFFFIGSISYQCGMAMMGLDTSHEEIAGLKESFVDAARAIWHGFLSIFGQGQTEWFLLANFFKQVFIPYFVGGIIPGLLGGALSYYLTRPLIAAYQNKRRKRMLDRTVRRRAQIIPGADAAE